MTDNASVIRIPELTAGLTGVWHLLFDLAKEVPDAWCLIGGLMVVLHGIEYGRTEVRPTRDGDVLVDIRAEQTALRQIAEFLTGKDMRPDPSPDGIVHRFRRTVGSEEVVIDILAPDNVGVRADLTTVPGGRTIEVPGGTQALNRAETVQIQVGDATGSILRPNLIGAILVKSAALGLPGDSERHIQDLTFLLSLMPDPLASRSTLTASERRKLAACPLVDRSHQAWRMLPAEYANAGHAALRLLSNSEPDRG